MTISRHLGNASIIIVKCVALRDDVLAVTYNVFLDLEVKGGSKVIIDCYHKKKVYLHYSIIMQIKDIWKFSQNINIYHCCHICREANKTTYFFS